MTSNEPSTYREHAPHPRSSPWIECYWTRRESQPFAPTRVLPDGCADFLFDVEHGGAWLIGAMSRPFEFRPIGAIDIVAVRFRPGAAHTLVRSALDAWTDDQLALRELGSWARELAERVHDRGSSDDRIAHIEDALWRRLADVRFDAIDRVLHELATDPAGFRVGAAAEASGLSRQWITRTIRARAGLGPKELARILRLRHSMARLHEPRSIADVAHASGFADQAHFTREARRIAGTTPARMRRGHE